MSKLKVIHIIFCDWIQMRSETDVTDVTLQCVKLLLCFVSAWSPSQKIEIQCSLDFVCFVV